MATFGQSKLLIDEHPLQVLPSLAVKYGLNEAIILQQVHYWIKHKPTEKDGYLWTFSTFERWLKQFPFFSRRTLERAISNLEKAGVLLGQVGLADDPRDRTKYYRIDYSVLAGTSPYEPVASEDDPNCGDAYRQNGGMGSRQSDDMHPAKMAVCIDKEEETLKEETQEENLSLTPFEGKAITLRQQFIECFKSYWEYCNPGEKMPFSKADGQAMDRFIRDHPEVTLLQFKRCLYHRSMSDVNPSQQLHRWIGRLIDYTSGPLDRYFNPKALGGTKHNEQRNLAAENAANLDSLLPRNGASGNHRGVAKGVRPHLESANIP